MRKPRIKVPASGDTPAVAAIAPTARRAHPVLAATLPSPKLGRTSGLMT